MEYISVPVPVLPGIRIVLSRRRDSGRRPQISAVPRMLHFPSPLGSVLHYLIREDVIAGISFAQPSRTGPV
jgi:hypothetical protein